MNLSLIISTDINNVMAIRDGSNGVSVAVNKNCGIRFMMVTMYTPDFGKNLIIVGRKTWDEWKTMKIFEECKYRDFLVLTHNAELKSYGNVTYVTSFEAALTHCIAYRNNYYKFFIAGGEQIFDLAMDSGFVKEVFWTMTHEDVSKDTLTTQFKLVSFRHLLHQYRIAHEKETKDMEYRHYERVYDPFETQYINLVRRIINRGIDKETRNGITRSINDVVMKFDLNDGFPILTIRRSFPRGILGEFFWIVSGSTDASVLKNANIHIWDLNSSQEFLNESGLGHLKESDIGSGYGFQLRHSGAKYIDCKTDYKGQGIDQLQAVADLIKSDPNNRRILINLWNVADLKQCVLPPCHLIYQFTVTEGRLNCHLYQRSWDICLGWNSSTAALFTHMLANYADLQVGTLTHTICDCHIYHKHLDGLKQFINKIPHKLPKLKINGDKPEKIDGYKIEQFVLENYVHHEPVSLPIQ